ncbi:DNA cytosine methyltransferase [Endozoicomonas sp. ONNA2]|uniref:DNA cytosine methyltransferase n=1 Tax=Endozoicomonas sp. ONNA2 TaxID=2828741 RepID=UPI0021485F7C
MGYLSLFSGIEAATVTWHPLGWTPAGFAEIEPFPSAVLEHHYPDVPNLGSVTDITEAMILKLGPIDLVVFGSPCQDLSEAGKRKGFDGERSGLFFAAIQIIRWARKYYK